MKTCQYSFEAISSASSTASSCTPLHPHPYTMQPTVTLSHDGVILASTFP